MLVAVVAYDGSAFYGSQSQEHYPTVLKSLQKAFKCCGLTSQILCASRTDRGVHALRNVVSIPMTYQPSSLDTLQSHLNKHLLPHIFISSLTTTHSCFHPRFCAKARLYRYIISPSIPNVFYARYIHFCSLHNIEILTRAIKLFEGEHDFRFFAKASNKNTIRHMKYTNIFWWARQKCFVLSFLANGFLHSQIRFMVQSLLELDMGKISIDELYEQILCQKRHTHHLAPAHGLYLSRVYY